MRSVSARSVSSGPETSSTPSNLPVKESVRGAAVQAHSWWCGPGARRNSSTGQPVTSASLMAFVPMPASDQSGPFGELQPVRPPQHRRAAHPPEDIAAVVGEHEQVSAGTGIVDQQVVQRGHDLLVPVPPTEFQDVRGVVQVSGLRWFRLMPRATERRHECARLVGTPGAGHLR